MTGLIWPTHKVKASARRATKRDVRKRNRKRVSK
jgi:hypothetical protein